MRRVDRAVREAERVLKLNDVSSLPVRVGHLAMKWAHVVEQPLDRDISGMLVPLPGVVDGKSWAIVVNRTHSEVRKRFTIAHELGHLLLHGYKSTHADRSFKIRLRDSHSSEGSVLEEIEANRFAAELLMPTQLLRARLANHSIEYAPAGKAAAADREIVKLAKEFDVSTQALQIRLSTLLA
jgi:Zn-dependent peptidase ImmA (M78 family)